MKDVGAAAPGVPPTVSVPRPLVYASAPVRICDIGGWTDTWFGGPGRVLNISMSPRTEVTLTDGRETPGATDDRLVQAALGEYAQGAPIGVVVSSGVAAGSALGTSSALAVALVGALLALRGRIPAARLVASEAHRLESEVLGEECGVQDQLAAAFGGICYVKVDHYPNAEVEPLPAWPGFHDLLSTVYLGEPHVSSEVHRDVIAGGDRNWLQGLRAAAAAARRAVTEQDLDAFGMAMRDNTDAQRALHPDIVGDSASEVIDVAMSTDAIGWKVNGAGGAGGSVTTLHRSVAERLRFESEIERATPARVLPLRPDQIGLSVELAQTRM